MRLAAFFGRVKPDPGSIQPVRDENKNYLRCSIPRPIPKNLPELAPLAQSRFPAKPVTSPGYAARRFLPRARLLFRMALPLLVLIRAMNPCFLFRRRLCG